jgi:hypothetical protein
MAHPHSARSWRWLSEDAIKPWTDRSWIFPRDPDFEPKAARVLDLYAGEWDGHPLKSDEFVISADEKTSIQSPRTSSSGKGGLWSRSGAFLTVGRTGPAGWHRGRLPTHPKASLRYS